MNSSPEKRTKSIRPEPAHQRPPTYATPTTSHSAIGRCRTISNPVSLRPVNGYALATTAAVANGTASHAARGRWNALFQAK